MICNNNYWLRLDPYDGGHIIATYVYANDMWTVGTYPLQKLQSQSWYHYVFSWDENDVRKCYINGALKDTWSNAIGEVSGSSQVTEIGSWAGMVQHWSNMQIDQFAWWNKILSFREVQALYNNGSGLAYSNW
jgi:hypothetical protein